MYPRRFGEEFNRIELPVIDFTEMFERRGTQTKKFFEFTSRRLEAFEVPKRDALTERRKDWLLEGAKEVLELQARSDGTEEEIKDREEDLRMLRRTIAMATSRFLLRSNDIDRWPREVEELANGIEEDEYTRKEKKARLKETSPSLRPFIEQANELDRNVAALIMYLEETDQHKDATSISDLISIGLGSKLPLFEFVRELDVLEMILIGYESSDMYEDSEAEQLIDLVHNQIVRLRREEEAISLLMRYEIHEGASLVVTSIGPVDESVLLEVLIETDDEVIDLSTLGVPGTYFISDVDDYLEFGADEEDEEDEEFEVEDEDEFEECEDDNFAYFVHQRAVSLSFDMEEVRDAMPRHIFSLLHELGHSHQELDPGVVNGKKQKYAETAKSERNAWARALYMVRALRKKGVDVLAPWGDFESAQRDMRLALQSYEVDALKSLGTEAQGLFLKGKKLLKKKKTS